MRSSVWWKRVVAGTAANAAGGGKKAEGVGEGTSADAAAAATAQAFRPLRLHPWQAFGIQLESESATPIPTTSASAEGPQKTSAAAASSVSLVSKAAMGQRLARLPASALLYHGNRLGPRPLIILDHSLPSPVSVTASHAPEVTAQARDGDVATNAAKDLQHGSLATASEFAVHAARKYESILSHLNWEHGAVYIPLHVSIPASSRNALDALTGGVAEEEAEAEESMLDASCRQVAAVLDALDIRWSHFLTYSYGTLVAARLAVSRTRPHRLGTLLSLDTPLVTRDMVKNAALRAELRAAEQDVNVPREELAFTRQMLQEGVERGSLPCPAEALAARASDGTTRGGVGADDGVATVEAAAAALIAHEKRVYEEYLFPSSAADDGALTREGIRYTPLAALAEMQHPFQLLVPSRGAVSDVLTHKEFFGLRRPAVIKAATHHAGLFGFGAVAQEETSVKKGGAAAEGEQAGAAAAAGLAAVKEVADVIGAWLNRFEPDVVLKRRYEQAAKEMNQLMGVGGGGGGGEAAGAASASEGKKKTKKEKKEGKKKNKG